jgi:hypothetical protein
LPRDALITRTLPEAPEGSTPTVICSPSFRRQLSIRRAVELGHVFALEEALALLLWQATQASQILQREMGGVCPAG